VRHAQRQSHDFRSFRRPALGHPHQQGVAHRSDFRRCSAFVMAMCHAYCYFSPHSSQLLFVLLLAWLSLPFFSRYADLQHWQHANTLYAPRVTELLGHLLQHHPVIRM
jgi:hypothetical protein